ncbi:MAG: hypothetical protein ABIS29_10995, partial [Vicinamibacterales bacterium]
MPGGFDQYRAYVFGSHTADFVIESVFGFLVFHGLVWASFLVIAGVMIAFRRCMVDHGAVTVQQFGLDTQLAPGFGACQDRVPFFCLTMWLGGGMLYIWIISLIFYRYMFFPLDPAHLTPPYWINMGAMAISTLAGAGLVANSGRSPLLRDLLPFLKGFTLLF